MDVTRTTVAASPRLPSSYLPPPADLSNRRRGLWRPVRHRRPTKAIGGGETNRMIAERYGEKRPAVRLRGSFAG